MQVLSNYWIPTVGATNDLASVNLKDCTKKKKNTLRSGKFSSTFTLLAYASNSSLHWNYHIGLLSCLGCFFFLGFGGRVSWWFVVGFLRGWRGGFYCLKLSPPYIQTVGVQNCNSDGCLSPRHPRLEFSSWKVSLSPVDLTFVNIKPNSKHQIHNKLPFF